MQAKFNQYEKAAGLFVLAAVVSSLIFLGLTAVKKGWLAKKIEYSTQVSSADGLYEGVPVKISGLRAGEVTEVELISASEVVVRFEVLEKMTSYIRQDSVVQIVRPFIIGDKAIEISVGSEESPFADPKQPLISVTSFDMMDLISGRKLGPFLGSLEGLMTNLSTLAQAFADPKRTQTLIRMFDRVDPMLVNLNKMSVEVTKLSYELNQVLPEMRETSPALGKNVAQLVKDLNILTQNLAPTLQEVGPELPQASRRALEALNEMVITLKAIQKSFLLSGNVKEVKAEEKARLPASDKKD